MKNILYIVTAFLILFIVSCQDDDRENINSTVTGNEFILSYTVSSSTTILTKSSVVAEEEEYKLNSFYVLFFEKSADGTGEFVDVLDGMGAHEQLPGTGEVRITIPKDSKIEETGTYKLLLCANLPTYSKDDISDIENLITFCQGKDEQSVRQLLLEIKGVDPSDSDKDNSNQLFNDNLPMYGSIVRNSTDKMIPVTLNRAVSRFDVFCEASGYELVSASLWNAYPQTSLWNEDYSDFSQPRTQRYYGVSADDNKEIIASLYAFENVVEEPLQNDDVTTCLIIGLKNNQGEVEYYRVNVTPSTINGQLLKRNNAYCTIVLGVNGEGSRTERDAYLYGESLLDIDINGWFLDDTGHVQTDGTNVLAIPSTHIKILPPLETAANYNVYTIGSVANPIITASHLPENISVNLQVATSQETFKIHTLSFTTNGSTIVSEDIYYVTISYAGMSATIRVSQEIFDGHFVNLSYTENLKFGPLMLQNSGDITVTTSSGNWTAKIYNSDYFSFNAMNPVEEIGGSSGSSFNINTLQFNRGFDSRYGFVVVSLDDMPNVSEVLVLEQYSAAIDFITVDPISHPTVSGGGGPTGKITVYSSGPWTAKLSLSTNQAYAFFAEYIEDDEIDEEGNTDENEKDEDETGPQTWEGMNGDSFILKFNGMADLGIAATATVTITLEDKTEISETFIINQRALSEDNVIVQTRKVLRPGSLNDIKSAYTYRYVYNLATNMRNTELFGKKGIVRMRDDFVFIKKGHAPLAYTKIYMIGYNPSPSLTNNMVDWWKADKDRLVFFYDYYYSHQSLDRFQGSRAGFGTSVGNKYVGAKIDVAKDVKRYFAKKAGEDKPDIENKLISYLLKDGPFTEGLLMDTDNIELYGKEAVNCGLSAWTDTFIPIIMVDKGGVSYCVFGIDPTNRLIFLGDPAIFGSSRTADSNYKNFVEKQENTMFLNNFIAWLANAGTMGNEFVKRYEK